MTIHYHGGPFSPNAVVLAMGGECFCISYANHRPRQTEIIHTVAQSVMHDNGAFSVWKKTRLPVVDWRSYYDWVEPLIENAVHWAVIPDEIDAGSQIQDYLIGQWPFGHRGAPVWHMDEPIDRFLILADKYPRVCIGSTAEYAIVLSDSWLFRMDELFEKLKKTRRFLPWIHMLRGMSTVKSQFPFSSVDSTDVAQNHHLCRYKVGNGLLSADMDAPETENFIRAKARRWSLQQCPDVFIPVPQQISLLQMAVE